MKSIFSKKQVCTAGLKIKGGLVSMTFYTFLFDGAQMKPCSKYKKIPEYLYQSVKQTSI